LTKSEAIDWVNYHSGAFTDFSKNYSGLSKEAKHYAMERICEELSDFSLYEAKRATDVMFRWDAAPRANVQLRKIIEVMQHQRESQRVKTDDADFQCDLCHDTGYAMFYAGCVPEWREKVMAMYKSDSCLWLKFTTNCHCGASTKPNRKLKKLAEGFVSAWLHKCELTEHQKDLVLNGYQQLIDWVKEPMEF
jgi:hypothetical protein